MTISCLIQSFLKTGSQHVKRSRDKMTNADRQNAFYIGSELDPSRLSFVRDSINSYA